MQAKAGGSFKAESHRPAGKGRGQFFEPESSIDELVKPRGFFQS